MADPRAELDSERAVLGAMMISPEAVGVALEVLDGSEFYRPAHEVLFGVVADLFADGRPTDATFVLSELSARKLVRQGSLDAPMLHGLVEVACPVPGVRAHAELVRGAAVVRRMGESAVRVLQAVDSGVGADDVVELAFSSLMHSATGYEQGGPEPVGAVLDRALAEVEDGGSGPVVSTGLADLDRVLTGLRAGNLVLVAGRPGMGKSTLALDVARDAALRQGVSTLFVSLEMSKTEVVKRLVSAEASVNLGRLVSSSLESSDWDRVARVTSAVSGAPLFIDEPAGLSPQALLAKCRRMVAAHGVGLVVVDYLQLMTGARSESRQQEVSDMSRALKQMARSLNVPVVALSQLNRGVEERTDKRPMLSDLRESGSLEQDADVVVLVHRPEVYDPDDVALAGWADLIVAKHRNGRTGDVRCVFQGEFSRFVDAYRP